MRDNDVTISDSPAISLGDWFSKAHPPVTFDYLQPAISPDIMGADAIPAGYNAVPPPQALYDLSVYKTPVCALWRRARTKLTG